MRDGHRGPFGTASGNRPGAHRRACQQQRAGLDRTLVDHEVTLVDVVRAPTRRAGAEPSHRAGDAREVPGEVLAAQRLLGQVHGVLAEHVARGRLEDRRRALVVLDRRHTALVPDLDVDAVGRDDLLDRVVEHLRRRLPRAHVQAAQRPAHRARAGDRRCGRCRPARHPT